MATDKKTFKYKAITDKILKAFYEVYNELGKGFLESVYENSLFMLLTEYGLHVEQQSPKQVKFRGTVVGEFRADLIVEQKVLFGLKAVKHILPEHQAQMINYLKATDIEGGLVLNFGDKPEFKRLVFSEFISVIICVNLWRILVGGLYG
ncbi:MAG TPA: GxxExxY protein [bacterium]|nr:GxxExxY protein [bacterium]